jgi:glycosyltransferase involved in cell wall biosynthesis
MVTYNQKLYICEAVESVLNQKTSFSFRLLIGDDASTDGTKEICMRYAADYPERICLINHQVNCGIIANYQSVLEACSAEYVAFLEGDDYWTLQEKLEKQVAYLDSQQQFGLVHSPVRLLYEKEGKFSDPPLSYLELQRRNQGDVYPALFHNNFIAPLSVLFRRSLLSSCLDFSFLHKKSCRTLDLFLWLGVAAQTYIGFLDETVGVYRILPNSISNSMDVRARLAFLDTEAAIRLYYLNKKQVPGIAPRDIADHVNTIRLQHSLESGSVQYAKEAAKSIRPGSIKTILQWLAAQNPILVRIYSMIFRRYQSFRRF